MLFKINGGAQLEYSVGDHIDPIKINSDLIIAVDPGKTNQCVIIGSTSGEVIMVLEMSGKDWSNKAIDTTDYCVEFSTFLKALLRESNIAMFGQEQAILPNGYGKGENHKRGMDFFHSQMVLTEIRAHLIMLARDLTGKKPYQINNQAWKGEILPDGYRGRNEKGSKRFIAKYAPQWAHFSHDVTDTLCIYFYMLKKYEVQSVIKCTRSETSNYKHNFMFVERSVLPANVKFFQYNEMFTSAENAAFYVNRSRTSGACKLPVQLIDIKEIYKHSLNLYTNSEVYMLVNRRGTT